jgi:CHAD domain-containing protein
MALDANRIGNTIEKLRKLLKKDSSLMTPDQVHTLRTHTRRVQAAVEAVEPLPRRNERRLFRGLRRMRKKAGKVRDLDVLTANLSGVKVEDHPDCLVQLMEHLGAQRFRRAKQLRASIRREGHSARRRLKVAARRLARIIDHKSSPGNQQNAETVAAAKALELSSTLATPASLNRGNLHPYRLKVKELRYVLQTAQAHGNDRFIEALGKSKDAIGEWHDWEELTAIAGDVLDDAPGCELMAKLKTIAGEKYESALSATNMLRARFAKQDRHRKNRRAEVAPQTSEPALEAVSALVN